MTTGSSPARTSNSSEFSRHKAQATITRWRKNVHHDINDTNIMNTFIRTNQHKKEQHKNSNIQHSLHIHQTSGTSNQQLNTAA